MGWVKPLIGIAVFGGVVSMGVSAANSDEHVVVNRVIDGDTIDVTIDGDKTRVRLLNIDTPEIGRNGKPSECLAEEAKEYLEGRLPQGTEVTLEYDEEKNDRYGRTLAGVFLGDDLVNADIAAEGLAVAMKVGVNDKFYNEVKEAESGPKSQGAGVFGVSDECQVSSDADMSESLQQAEGATAAAAGIGELMLPASIATMTAGPHRFWPRSMLRGRGWKSCAEAAMIAASFKKPHIQKLQSAWQNKWRRN